jgi:hypothetical protein
VINRIARRAIMASQKAHLLNMMASTMIEYGMCVVQYPQKILMAIDVMMKRIVKRSLRIANDCASNWLWASTKDGGMGLTRVEDTQKVAFLGGILNQIMRGLDSLGQRVIISNLSTYRRKGEWDVLSIGGGSEGSKCKRLTTMHLLTKLLREENLEIVLETIENEGRERNKVPLESELEGEWEVWLSKTDNTCRGLLMDLRFTSHWENLLALPRLQQLDELATEWGMSITEEECRLIT